MAGDERVPTWAVDALVAEVGSWPPASPVLVQEQRAREMRLLAHLAGDELEDARREVGSLRAALSEERSHSASLARTIAALRRGDEPWEP